MGAVNHADYSLSMGRKAAVPAGCRIGPEGNLVPSAETRYAVFCNNSYSTRTGPNLTGCKRGLQKLNEFRGLCRQKLGLRKIREQALRRQRDALEDRLQGLALEFRLHRITRNPDDPAALHRHLSERRVAVGRERAFDGDQERTRARLERPFLHAGELAGQTIVLAKVLRLPGPPAAAEIAGSGADDVADPAEIAAGQAGRRWLLAGDDHVEAVLAGRAVLF